MNLGYDSERKLCAGRSQPLQSHRYPQWGSHCYREWIKLMQMLRQFVAAPALSGEHRPKSQRGIVWVVSSNHWFKPVSSAVPSISRTLWNVLGYFLVSCLVTSARTAWCWELCHQWGQQVPTIAWNLSYHSNGMYGVVINSTTNTPQTWINLKKIKKICILGLHIHMCRGRNPVNFDNDPCLFCILLIFPSFIKRLEGLVQLVL